MRVSENCRGGPGACPDRADEEPYCETCPRGWLADAERSSSGALLRRSLDTEFALRQRVQMRLAEIPADEWGALKIIDGERNKYERERADGARMQAPHTPRR